MPSIAAVRKRPAGFVLAGIFVMGAWIVSAAGLDACLVGVLVSTPIGHAMAARIAASWQADLEAPSAE